MLTTGERHEVERMQRSGASWLIIALMLTIDRKSNHDRGAPPFGLSGLSYDLYRSVVDDLTAEFGPQVQP